MPVAPTKPPIHFVLPGGVACVAHQAGTTMMRVTKGWITTDEGLLTELREGRPKIPWISRDAREEAIASITGDRFIGETDRADLLAWVRATPFYDQ